MGQLGSDTSQGRTFQQQLPHITQGACMAQLADTRLPRQSQKRALLQEPKVRTQTKPVNSLQLGDAHWLMPVPRLLKNLLIQKEVSANKFRQELEQVPICRLVGHQYQTHT